MRRRHGQRGLTVTLIINGDGDTSRDVYYIANVVQANPLASTSETVDAVNQAYNVAAGDRGALNEMFALVRDNLVERGVDPKAKPEYRDFRAGDLRHHRQAGIFKSRRLLGYVPSHGLTARLAETMPRYKRSEKYLQLAALFYPFDLSTSRPNPRS